MHVKLLTTSTASCCYRNLSRHADCEKRQSSNYILPLPLTFPNWHPRVSIRSIPNPAGDHYKPCGNLWELCGNEPPPPLSLVQSPSQPAICKLPRQPGKTGNSLLRDAWMRGQQSEGSRLPVCMDRQGIFRIFSLWVPGHRWGRRGGRMCKQGKIVPVADVFLTTGLASGSLFCFGLLPSINTRLCLLPNPRNPVKDLLFDFLVVFVQLQSFAYSVTELYK